MSLVEEFKNKYPLAYNHQVASCPEGWLKLLEPVLEKIQRFNESNPKNQILFTTIKEKYGTLNIYVNFLTDDIDDEIEKAEALSEKMCETCGKEGTLKIFKGWMYTSCEEHERK